MTEIKSSHLGVVFRIEAGQAITYVLVDVDYQMHAMIVELPDIVPTHIQKIGFIYTLSSEEVLSMWEVHSGKLMQIQNQFPHISIHGE